MANVNVFRAIGSSAETLGSIVSKPQHLMREANLHLENYAVVTLSRSSEKMDLNILSQATTHPHSSERAARVKPVCIKRKTHA